MGESVSASSFSTDTLDVTFKYQATQEFDIDFNWALELDKGIGDWLWSYDTIGGVDSGSDIGRAGAFDSLSGVETITLPASILGTFTCRIRGDTEDMVSGSIYIT